MSDQLLPDFDGPGNQPDEMRPGPKKPRRKPAKKKARAASVLKPAKRVPKKRRVRKTPIQYGTAEQKIAAGRAFAAEAKNMSFEQFVELLFGFKLEPWQVRLIKALEQSQK